MKKLLAVLLCLLLAVSFVGCKNNEADKNPEIENLAISGKIDGIEFGLGSNVEEVKRHYSALAQNGHTHTEEDENHNHD